VKVAVTDVVMPAGRHRIVLVSERYGFGESREITIEPGSVTRVAVDLPAGGVHVDAPAGSEVYLDGERVGTAPMPPIDVPLGTHNVLVKGPQGEQQRAFVVTLREPVRLAFTPGR